MLLAALLLLAPVLARAQAADSLTLHWTAPADPPGGAVSRYDVRWAAFAIDSSNFDSCVTVPNSTPQPPGARESVVIRGLPHGTPCWFAIRSCDAAGNWSGLSNVVRWNGILDATPPGAPGGLAANVASDGKSVRLGWWVNTEPDLAGYRVYRAGDESGPWTALTAATISDNLFVDGAPPAGSARLWYEVSAVDRTGNESARSASVTVVLGAPHVSWPTAWHLLAPYPNPAPAGASMRIGVEVPLDAAEGRIEIVDAANRIVRRFAVRPGATGLALLAWDGTNDRGAPCAPGVYRACLVAGELRQSVRIARVP